MGSWSNVSGFMMGWEFNSPQQRFMELGFQDLISNNNNGAAFYREEESSSKLSSSVVESNSRDSSVIDLKLGGFPDHPEGNNIKSPKMNNTVSSARSPAKRMRTGGLNFQTPYCQVHGCKKDLSSCKDYHRRHRVCEVHSKTPKVIVNGMEQRFCQQCSRFHLLEEFDDGKRSCRKRLAGHNERRRKPHVGMNSGSGRIGRSFRSYTGARFEGAQCLEWYKNVKVEEGIGISPVYHGQVLNSLGPSIHGLSGMSNSGGALSPLSSHSILPPPHSHYDMLRLSAASTATLNSSEDVPLLFSNTAHTYAINPIVQTQICIEDDSPTIHFFHHSL